MRSIESGKNTKHQSVKRDSTHLVNEPGGQWADHWSKERCHTINHHRTGKGEGQFLVDSLFATNASQCGRGREAHVAISEDKKRSLTVPPVTDKNAAPQKPVMKRNKMRTAGRMERIGGEETFLGKRCHAPTLGANATGQEKIKSPMKDPRYTGFLPEKNSAWTSGEMWIVWITMDLG